MRMLNASMALGLGACCSDNGIASVMVDSSCVGETKNLALLLAKTNTFVDT